MAEQDEIGTSMTNLSDSTNSRLSLNTNLKTSAVLLLSSLMLTTAAQAHAGHEGKQEVEFEAPTPKPLQPATHYSGSTPTDLKNGILFNNGTYGLPNSEYEEWSKSLTAVGISDKQYPYESKTQFTDAYVDRLAFFDAALYNWKTKTDITKPEAVEYGKQATETISPRLEKAKDALKSAESAGKDSWDGAQTQARHALVELQATYYSLHHNVAPAMRK